MRFLITISTFLLLTFSIYSQTDQLADDKTEKKKILVIPYVRLEFHTDIPITEIATINKISSNEVYKLYVNTFIETLQSSGDDNFEFITPEGYDLNKLQAKIRYDYNKKESYYAVSLNKIAQEDFKALLEKYHADLIVFINWYRIKKSTVHVSNVGGKLRKPFTNHYIDFDIYDKFKRKIFGTGKYLIQSELPTPSNYTYKNLRVKELVIGYHKFGIHLLDIIENPNQYIKN
jgi:hypothetical protein